MSLRSVIEKGKAIIISPYTNLNIVLGLHIAQHVASYTFAVYVFSEYPIPTSLLAIVKTDKGMHIRFLDSLSNIVRNSVLIAILGYLNAEVYSTITDSTSNFYVFVHRFSIPRLRNRKEFNLYRVKKVGENTYVIRSSDYGCLIKVSGGIIEEVEIPSEVLLIIKELRELTTVFGSVKISDFLKYLSRKYGYSRDRCLELIRRAEALGLVKYAGGYLLA